VALLATGGAAQDCAEPVGGLGSARAVATQGNYLYYGSGGAFTVADLSDPRRPATVGQVLLPELIESLAVSGTLAVAGGSSRFLHVLDLSNPSAPVEVGTAETAVSIWGFRGLALSGSYAYAATDSWGLRVFDVSVPSAPVEVGSLVPAVGGVWDVALSGPLAFLADLEGLRVADVADPTSPREIGLGRSAGGQAVVLDGSHAYLAGDARFEVFDVSTPTSPAVVAWADTSDVSSDVAVSAGFAFVTHRGGLMRVFDVADPTRPVEVGPPGVGGGDEIAVGGDFAYLANPLSGLVVLDVSTPSAPIEASVARVPEEPHAIALSGSRAVVADQSSVMGLRVVDLGPPPAPVEIGFEELPSFPWSVALLGDLAFVAGAQSGLRVVDLSVSSAPVEIGWLDTPGLAFGVSVAGDGGLVCVADREGGLRVIDVSVPSAPAEIGWLAMAEQALEVAVSGRYAYVAAQLGVVVVDLAFPASPIEVGLFDSPGEARGVAVSGTVAYVREDDPLVRILDLSDPTTPADLGDLDFWGGVEGVAAAGSRLYVAEGFTPAGAQLHVFEVSTPSSPVEVHRVAVPPFPVALAVAGAKVAIGHDEAGLSVYDLADCCFDPPGAFALREPPDGATVAPEVALGWDVGTDTTAWEVYLDTVDPPLARVAQGWPDPTLELTVAGTGTWYWRVVATRGCGRTESEVRALVVEDHDVLRYDSRVALTTATPDRGFTSGGWPFDDPDGVLRPAAPPLLFYRVASAPIGIVMTRTGNTVRIALR